MSESTDVIYDLELRLAMMTDERDSWLETFRMTKEVLRQCAADGYLDMIPEDLQRRVDAILYPGRK